MATVTYEEVVLEDNPDIFLRFTETGGTNAADSSGNGRDFTHAGSPTLDQAGPSGIGGKAVSYDGSDDETTYSVDMPITGYPFTIEAWHLVPGPSPGAALFCRMGVGESSANDNKAYIASRTEISPTKQQVLIDVEQAGTDDNFFPDIKNDGSLFDEWVHIVGVYVSATERKIYANGVFFGTDTTSITFPSGLDFFALGKIPQNGAVYSAGSIAEPAFYNHELIEERIRIHHAVGRGFTDDASFGYAAMSDGPGIYLKLDDASGNAVDSSGWKRDATAAGSPTYGATGPLTDGSEDDAITFDGTDDAFVVAGDDLGITDYPLTIEMFGKTPAGPANSTSFARLMFGDDGTEDNFFGLDLTTDGSGNPEARGLLETGGTADHLFDAVDLNADQFYHLVWRLVSATDRRLYVEGAEVATDTTSRAFGSNINDLVIGRDLASSPGFYAGTMGQILVYPRDIGATAVSDHFNAATIVPMGEQSVVGRMDALVQVGPAARGLSFATLGFNSGGMGIRVEMAGSITKDFRNVQSLRGAIGIIAELDGVVSAQFTQEREGRIDIVAEFNSPVTFEKMKTGQIDAIVDLVASKTEGATPVTDQDIGEAIIFRAPKIDYVFRANKHPTGRKL